MSHKDPERRREYGQEWRAKHRAEAAEHRRAWLAEWRSRFARTGEIPGEHSQMAYEIGCRCRICRTAHNEYQREWQQRWRDEQRRAKDLNSDFDWEGAS